jgi:hypothetical protein
MRTGEAQAGTLIKNIADMVIKDKLVPPTEMTFALLPRTGGDGYASLALHYAGMNDPDDPKKPLNIAIHRHALGQLAEKVKFPITYLNTLNIMSESWRPELLVENLNTLFHKTKFMRNGETPRFLHRLVGNELRGFLSRRFNRHLASLPLLRAFVEAVHFNGGKPVETTTTDLRWSLKCFLPQVFEPFPGQYICIGVTQSHSDFGAGKHSIAQSIWDPLRDTRTVLEGVSRVHLGSVIEDSDIEMNDDTALAEVEAQAQAARHTVATYLGDEHISKAMRAVKLANEAQIPWSDLRSQLTKVLYEKELASVETFINSPGIIDLPPIGKTATGEPLPSKWWASQVLSKMATDQDDDRKIELQQIAGKWLA